MRRIPRQFVCRRMADTAGRAMAAFCDAAFRKRYAELERLDDLEAFLAIIERGSQAAASRHLRRPLQSLNRSLIALERAVGVELVKRTTRRSEPTEAGRVFYERIKPAVAEITPAAAPAAPSVRREQGALNARAPCPLR